MEVDKIKESVLAKIKEYHDMTGGHCGMTPGKLRSLLDVDFQLLRDALNQLYEESMITVRKGINGLLVFHKKTFQ